MSLPAHPERPGGFSLRSCLNLLLRLPLDVVSFPIRVAVLSLLLPQRALGSAVGLTAFRRADSVSSSPVVDMQVWCTWFSHILAAFFLQTRCGEWYDRASSGTSLDRQ